MTASTAAELAELAELRARAYGPGADIDDDPAALVRLRELEDAERAARPTPALDVSGAQGGSVHPAPADGAAEPAVESDGSSPVESESVASRAPRPIAVRWLVAWAGSVVAVAVVVGALVFGFASIRPVSPVTGATQVATLTETIDPPAWVTEQLGSDENQSVYEFQGMLVIRSQQGVYTAGQDCLSIMGKDAYDATEQSFQGPFAGGCGAGRFPPAAQFVVGADAPRALKERFATGTALQFVAGDGAVGVFAADPLEPSPSAPAR